MTTNAVPTPDEIWQILREVSANLEETAASQKETAANQKETSAIGKETDKRLERFRISQEESSRKASREIEEIRASQKETDRQLKETDKQLKKTEALFNTQWGRLMESLVEGDLIAILNQQGIQIAHISTNAKQRGRGDDYEYDIIAVNGEEVVVVEVKTTLRVQDVKDFLVSLEQFTTRMPYHKGKTIYGAVAWLRADAESDTYAEKQGLFVIRATGSSASIVNREDFKPQIFS